MATPDECASETVTAGYEAAERFLAALGFRDMDVTDILISRERNEGQRSHFAIKVKALGPVKPEADGT